MARCAIVSVTETGALRGAQIASLLAEDVDLYEREGRGSGVPARYFSSTPKLTTEIFGSYEVILYIMAVGIVVRSIAPHVQDKTRDPAVLVMDELGLHTISLLSGHLGGANEWTRKIAALIDSQPVITTATDVHGKTAPDVLARKISAKVEPLAALKPVNAAVARGETIGYYLDESMAFATEIKEIAAQMGIQCQPLEGHPDCDAAVFITDKELHLADVKVPYLFLRPPTLIVGMGCRRGTDKDMLAEALQQACREIGRSPLSVGAFTSVTIKADEEGLLDLVKEYRRQIDFYTPEEIETVIAKYGLEESEFVKKTIGVGNVCETTIALKTGKNKFLMKKTKYPRATVAIAEATSLSSVWDRGMKKK